MSSRFATWDAFDPLVDGLYSQAPYSDDDVLSDPNIAAHNPDKATIRRYEDVARRYLSGYGPLLITSTLRGPFDRASGFVNPWARPVETSQPTTQPSSPRTLRTKQSPPPYEPAVSPCLGKTQTTESSYLPSPESLNLGNHPFLERDEVIRVQKWRELVESNIPTREEFWASRAPLSTKRAAEDSSWLKRRAYKRPRTLEPEPKLSSPVSIPDKNLQQRDASSPLSSLTSLGNQPTPRRASSRATSGVRVENGESTVAQASQNALPSCPQRLQQRDSRSSRLPSKSETSRIEKHPRKLPKTAATKSSSKRASPIHRSAPALELQSNSDTTDDSTTESGSSQSSDEEVPEIKEEVTGPGDDEVHKIKQEVMEPVDGPTVFEESDEDMNGQDVAQKVQPGEDRRIQQVISDNAAPGNAEADPESVASDREDSIARASKPPVDAFSRKPSNLSLGRQGPLAGRNTVNHAVSSTPVAPSPNSDLQNNHDSLCGRSQDKVASEHSHMEHEPTSAPDTAEADQSADTSVTTAWEPADFSTTLVEDGAHVAMKDAQSPHECQLPKPAVSDAARGLRSSLDNANPDDEGQPQHAETCSTSSMHSSTPVTPLNCESREPDSPEQRIATQQQSPWAKDSWDVVDQALEREGQPRSTPQEDEHIETFVIPPEAQSPWMQQPVSQPQPVPNAVSSHCSTSRLFSHSRTDLEEPQPQADTDRSNVTSDLSNTEFSIKSFSSFMSPVKTRPHASDACLPHTPSLLAAATENPWQSSSKPKKRVSWAPLPHEVDGDMCSPAPTPSFRRASPPPATPIPDDVVEGAEVFKKHFTTVKRRTDPVRQRLLPSASQQSQRSPEPEAMARTFVTAESPLGSSPTTNIEGVEQKRDEAGVEGEGEKMEEAPVDEVDDVLANLGDFLTTWDVETDLERAKAEERAGATATRGILGVEVGGW
ncbi:hypothetical protein VUR80DRAFT_4839 [Thermomyces stellatus]